MHGRVPTNSSEGVGSCMSHAKKQHCVPRFLLRNFAGTSPDHLFGFDKQSVRAFGVSVGDAAAQNGFYDFEISGSKASIEESLSELEYAASIGIAKIVANESLAALTTDDKSAIGLFCAVQLRRVQNYRAMQQDLVASLRRVILDSGADPAQVDGFGNPSEEDVRVATIRGVVDSEEMLPLLLSKCWAIQRAPADSPLWISDNPLARFNANDSAPYGNLGLAVRGIELHLPLSSKLSLWMACPTIRMTVSETLAKVSRTSASNSSPEVATLHEIMRGFDSGTPVTLSPENVRFLNALQVSFAERFIYASEESFILATQMIEDDAAFKVGPRFRLG